MTSDSKVDAAATDPHWGSSDRDQKARNILQCLDLLTDLDLGDLSCVDIGCGSGGISLHLAPAFKSVCGVDPEPWERWQEYSAQCPGLSFHKASIDSLGIADNSVDVVICNQVYEHVPSPETLIAQIFRILKPGGICYFAGPNLLYPIEPHVHWPFIHWIPRRPALAIIRSLAPHKILDAYSTTYWQLKRWLADFTIVDAVPQLIKHRAESPQAGNIWRIFRITPLPLLRALGFLSPGFVFLLTKPGNSPPAWAGSSSALASRSLNVANRAASYVDTFARAKDLDVPAPIFVVGLPRSGTTLAYELIVQAFDVAYLTRAYSFTYGIPNLTTRVIARFARHPKAHYVSNYGRIPGFLAPAENAVLWMKWFTEHPMLGHYFPDESVNPAAAADATKTIASMSAIAKRTFVFKNIYLTLALPALLRTLTKSKVIVVTRDIDDVTASVFNRRRTLPASSWWSIRPPFVGQVSGDGILEQTTFQCTRSRQILERSLTLVDPDRCMVVDYSDICRSPLEFIENVARLAGNELGRRAGTDIPQHFDVSQSKGLPKEMTGQFSRLSDALNSDGHQYLRQVDEYVTQHTRVVTR